MVRFGNNLFIPIITFIFIIYNPCVKIFYINGDYQMEVEGTGIRISVKRIRIL